MMMLFAKMKVLQLKHKIHVRHVQATCFKLLNVWYFNLTLLFERQDFVKWTVWTMRYVSSFGLGCHYDVRFLKDPYCWGDWPWFSTSNLSRKSNFTKSKLVHTIIHGLVQLGFLNLHKISFRLDWSWPSISLLILNLHLWGLVALTFSVFTVCCRILAGQGISAFNVALVSDGTNDRLVDLQ